MLDAARSQGIEMAVIAIREEASPELEAIANDGAVLDLARARARSLLERTVASR